VGPLGKGARNWRDSNIDANCGGNGSDGVKKVNRYVKGAALGSSGFGGSKASKRGKELEDRIEGVSYAVVEGGLVSLRKPASKEMIAMGINEFCAERAW
jgi:hypothetical protein